MKYLSKGLHMAELAWHNKSAPVSWVTVVCSLPTGTEIPELQQCVCSEGCVCMAQPAARHTWLG